MNRPKLMLAALLALPLMTLACDGQPAANEPDATSDRPQAGTEGQAAQGMPAEGASAVELGSELGPEGDVKGNSTSFRAGDPVFAEIQAGGFPAGASVRLAWVGPQGSTVGTDELVLPAEARAITLKAKDTSSWVPGDYRVDVAVGGTSVGSRSFTISERGAAD